MEPLKIAVVLACALFVLPAFIILRMWPVARAVPARIREARR